MIVAISHYEKRISFRETLTVLMKARPDSLNNFLLWRSVRSKCVLDGMDLHSKSFCNESGRAFLMTVIGQVLDVVTLSNVMICYGQSCTG